MKTLIKVILYTLFLSILSCKTPNILLSKNLKDDTSVYEIKGRQGWQFNQVLEYGKYYTSKIKRGWSLGYDFPFVVHFQGAKEKLNFKQSTPYGESAIVSCVGKFKNIEIPLLKDYFGLELDYQDYFAGSIKNKKLNWDFIIYNPDGNSIKDITSGMLINQNNKSEKIIIKAVKEIEGQANWINIDVNGYEFIYKDTSIGAISLLNNGRIWISNKIDNNTKLTLSSVMSSLAVRHSMSENLNE